MVFYRVHIKNAGTLPMGTRLLRNNILDEQLSLARFTLVGGGTIFVSVDHVTLETKEQALEAMLEGEW